jgi:hypothetical protein
MEGKLPEIYWYIFWIGFVLVMTGGMAFAGIINHRRNMKALDILKMYAEKGIEPPPAVFEALARPAHEQHKPQEAKTAGQQAGITAGVRLGNFIGSLFGAGMTGGLAWWAAENKGPEWLFYGAVIVTIACLAGAVVHLTTVVFTFRK